MKLFLILILSLSFTVTVLGQSTFNIKRNDSITPLSNKMDTGLCKKLLQGTWSLIGNPSVTFTINNNSISGEYVATADANNINWYIIDYCDSNKILPDSIKKYISDCYYQNGLYICGVNKFQDFSGGWARPIYSLSKKYLIIGITKDNSDTYIRK